MNWFIHASRHAYRALIAVLAFCNILEDEAPGRPRRLSLTNVSFVGAMILGAAVVTKSVLTPDSASVTEFAMAAAVSVVAALLKERKSQRRRDDLSEDCDV
jgi:hypothetical protein